MKKKLLKLPASAELDAMCAAYLEAEAARDRLWQQLYTLTRGQGCLLKDAPRSRLLAGAQFEALASLATRTDVDQEKADAANITGRLPRFAFQCVSLWVLQPDWERVLATLSTRQRELFRARVLACLRTRPVKRLTVRKRKSVAAGSSRQERAA